MQDNPVLILIKCISAVFLNRQLSSPIGAVVPLASKLLNDTRMPKDVVGDGGANDAARALMTTYEWLRSTRDDDVITKRDVVDRIRINCIHDNAYESIINDTLSIEGDDADAIRKRVRGITNEMRAFKRKRELAKLLSAANRRVNFNESNEDLDTYMGEFQQDLNAIVNTDTNAKEGLVAKIDFSSLTDIEETLQKTKDVNGSEGVLKTGWIALNKGLGIGGYRRGELVNWGALTHNYKTGVLLDHCRWFPMYNTPYMLDSDKKPAIVRLSFENKPEQDLPLMYRSLWEAEHKKKCDIKEINVKEAAQYIQEKLGANGYTFFMECYDPNGMDVWDIIDILNGYEAAGYEIHGLIVDYPELICGRSNSSRKDELINSTYEVLRNHCFPRGITVIAAHQLSTEAQRLTREGTSNFVQKVSTGGWYMYSQSLHTKLDCEWLIHIHKVGEDSYLTAHRGKHRGGDQTPMKHRFFAMKFQEYGGINDDLLSGECTAIYNLNSVSLPGSDTAQSAAADDW